MTMTPNRYQLRVGVRELQDRLSHYLSLVEEGAEIIVTKRGRRIARLGAIDQANPMEELIRRGLVTLPKNRPQTKSTTRTRVKASRSVSELVKDQRR